MAVGYVQICILLHTDNHASTPPLSFLQAGCPSCHPTNSIKVLKANNGSWYSIIQICGCFTVTLDNHFTLLCRGCPPALSMSVSRKVVRCTIQLYHEKKDELRIQPSVDSSNETVDTDSPATTNPGVKQLLLMVLKWHRWRLPAISSLEIKY